jgi:hypothetical protein
MEKVTTVEIDLAKRVAAHAREKAQHAYAPQ